MYAIAVEFHGRRTCVLESCGHEVIEWLAAFSMVRQFERGETLRCYQCNTPVGDMSAFFRRAQAFIYAMRQSVKYDPPKDEICVNVNGDLYLVNLKYHPRWLRYILTVDDVIL